MCQRGHLQACDCTHLTHASFNAIAHGTSFNDSHVWFSQAPHTNSCTLIRGYSACACKDRTAPILKCQRAGCRCQLQNLLLEKHTFDAACSCWRTMQRTYKCPCTHTHMSTFPGLHLAAYRTILSGGISCSSRLLGSGRLERRNQARQHQPKPAENVAGPASLLLLVWVPPVFMVCV